MLKKSKVKHSLSVGHVLKQTAVGYKSSSKSTARVSRVGSFMTPRAAHNINCGVGRKQSPGAGSRTPSLSWFLVTLL